MNTTSYEKGLEKGRREMVQLLLEERFGPLPPRVVERLERLSAVQVIALSKAALRTESLAQLGLED